MDFAIRQWHMEDAAPLTELLNNRHILDNLRDGIPYPYTEEDARAFIREMLEADPGQTFPYAITAGGRLAGSIGIYRCGNIHFRTAELGYYIGEAYWGMGLATYAVQQACADVFARTDILRIFAEPFSYNAASCRVLEKSGFQYEGLLRSNAVKNGKILDMKMYARLKQDSVPGYIPPKS